MPEGPRQDRRSLEDASRLWQSTLRRGLAPPVFLIIAHQPVSAYKNDFEADDLSQNGMTPSKLSRSTPKPQTHRETPRAEKVEAVT